MGYHSQLHGNSLSIHCICEIMSYKHYRENNCRTDDRTQYRRIVVLWGFNETVPKKHQCHGPPDGESNGGTFFLSKLCELSQLGICQKYGIEPHNSF